MTGSGVRLAEQGHFWLGLRLREHDGQRVPDGDQLFVEYHVPEEQRHETPVVLIHGGGGQGLDWSSTPDGRPGWRTLLLQRGYAVYTIDRPGHGRSPRSIGEPVGAGLGLVPSVEALGAIFAGRDDPAHTQWPGSGGADDPALLQLLAAQRQTAFDLEHDHATMRRVGAELLDRIGPAVLIASSAGGPSAWQLAAARPELVRAVVALEPLGIGGPGPLEWGISAVPIALESLRELPIAIVTAECSPAGRSGTDAATVDHLRDGGCTAVDHLVLPDLGIRGNGHLMFLERNHEEVLGVVTEWLDRRVRTEHR